MTVLTPSNGAAAEWLANPRALAVMPKEPKGDISRRRNQDDLPEYVTIEEVTRATSNVTPMAALIGFLWATGARISEALELTPADIDVARGMVRLRTLKRRRKDGSGRKTSTGRVVPVAGHLYLPRVLGVIVASRIEATDRVWPIGRRWAWRGISAHLEAVGVDKARSGPHALRHGHAVHAVRNGVSIELIQKQLGHRSIVTTAIYLRVTGQDLAAEYARFIW